ncbi:MAG: cell division protein FtsA [Muribaculaceae bacterium]|nr:cell division protein FtsA [Bacteroides sp.]MDE5846073.1 cell division protein FtsA [Muribaculaceae bacterium]MDE6057525.1 cell division protein FtsA [Muribaculaceae bacterium]MDE6194141.1 cell division protein FtsA [Muribaculaceae bacterium]
MATDRYIAALEISSSKVIGAIGVMGRSGQLEILAVERERSLDSVRYGLIQNAEETSVLINRVIERLERRPNIAPREITAVYAGLSGRSLRSIEKEVSLSLPDDSEITPDIISRLRKKALEAEIDNSLEVVDAVPRIFTVGRTETHRPMGMMGNNITAIYDIIVARPAMQNNLRRVVRDKLDFDINLKKIVITPLATAEIVLNEHEKKLGCMLVDIGAETTSVTIYTRGNLVYYATLPLGGRNITLDLKALNVIEDKAEDLKVTFGNALAPATPSQEMVGPHKLSQISNYVVARAEEIVANIVEQIRYAHLTEKDIPEGIVICGGGARLNGIAELIEKFSGLKVRMATLPPTIRLSDPSAQGMECLQVAAIMYEGAKVADEDCLRLPAAPEPEPEQPVEEPKQPEEPKREPKKKKRPFWETISKFFTPLGDDDDGEELI